MNNQELAVITQEYINNFYNLKKVAKLNSMMHKEFFSVCVIYDLDTTKKFEYADTEAYKILGLIHCHNWNEIPEPLLDAIPDLLYQCCGARPTFIRKRSVIISYWKKFIGFFNGLYLNIPTYTYPKGKVGPRM